VHTLIFHPENNFHPVFFIQALKARVPTCTLNSLLLITLRQCWVCNYFI